MMHIVDDRAQGNASDRRTEGAVRQGPILTSHDVLATF
jgi:hypothetical protein